MQQQRPAEVVVVMNQGWSLSDPPDGDRLLRAAVRDEGQGHTEGVMTVGEGEEVANTRSTLRRRLRWSWT